jgi:thymidine phosphorylase
VKAERAGFVGAIDTRALGVAVVALGGGRTRPGQAIDLSVGLDAIARVGDAITPGDILARVHARSNAEAKAAAARVRSAFQIAEERPRRRRLVQERVGLAATD